MYVKCNNATTGVPCVQWNTGFSYVVVSAQYTFVIA